MKYRFIWGNNPHSRTICIEADSQEEAEREIRKDYPMAEFLMEVTTKRKEKQP